MSDISKVTLRGVTYDIKDTVAREAAAAHLRLLRVPELPLPAAGTCGVIYLVPKTGLGGLPLDTYTEWITIDNGNGTYQWEKIGSTDGHGEGGAAASHKHNVQQSITIANHTATPQGTITTPVFSGSASTISTSGTPNGSVTIVTASGANTYTPAGTVSQPTFTGNNLTSTGTVTPIGSVEAPTITSDTVNAANNTTMLYSMKTTGNVVAPTFTKGTFSVDTDGNLTITDPVFSAGQTTMPEREYVKVKSTATAPAFTGTATTVSVDGVPTGAVSQPVFAGAASVVNGTFTGEASTFTGAYTPAGTVTQPIFVGIPQTLEHTVTAPDLLTSEPV